MAKHILSHALCKSESHFSPTPSCAFAGKVSVSACVADAHSAISAVELSVITPHSSGLLYNRIKPETAALKWMLHTCSKIYRKLNTNLQYHAFIVLCGIHSLKPIALICLLCVHFFWERGSCAHPLFKKASVKQKHCCRVHSIDRANLKLYVPPNNIFYVVTTFLTKFLNSIFHY